MIVCKKCGKENPEEFKFCGYCGSNLDGKVQCRDCNNWIPEEYAFCPHCGRKVNSNISGVVENSKQPVFKKNDKLDSILPILTNSIVLFFCLIMALIMFGKVSLYKQQLINFDNNVFDYCEASINGLKKFTTEDFRDKYQDLEVDDLRKINFLNIFMVDDDEYKTESNSTLIHLSTIVLLAMIITPLILIGLTINDLVKKRVKGRYRLFFLVNIALGLSLIILFSLMKFKVGFVVILYLIMSALPLIYDYIIQLTKKEVKLNPLRLVTPIIIIVTFIMLNGSVATYKDKSMGSYTEKIEYGTFVSVIDSLYQKSSSGLSLFSTPFTNMFVSKRMQEANVWIIYFSLIIPLFVVTSLGFLITSFISEARDNLNMNEDDDSRAVMYLWVSVLFSILSVAAVIVVNQVSSHFFSEFGHEYLSLTLSPNIVVVTILLLCLAVFRSIINNKVYKQ